MTDPERHEHRERQRQRERRVAVLAVVALFLLVLAVVVVQSARGDEPPPPPPPPTLRGQTIEQWAALANKRLGRLGRRERQLRRAHRHVERLRQAMRARVSLAGAGSGTRGLLCIHQYEGAWNDPAPPYFGGLQMDLSFQRTWGAVFLAEYGTADNWPPFLQLAVGLAAYTQRGFSPWPLSRQACGL